MDVVDNFIKASMSKKDYLQLQKDAEVYQRIQNDRFKKQKKESEQKKRMQRRRMNYK